MTKFRKDLIAFLKPLIVHFIVSVILIGMSVATKFLLEWDQLDGLRVLRPEDYTTLDRYVSKFILILSVILIVNCVLFFILNTVGPLIEASKKTFWNRKNALNRKPRNNNDKEFAPILA